MSCENHNFEPKITVSSLISFSILDPCRWNIRWLKLFEKFRLIWCDGNDHYSSDMCRNTASSVITMIILKQGSYISQCIACPHRSVAPILQVLKKRQTRGAFKHLLSCKAVSWLQPILDQQKFSAFWKLLTIVKLNWCSIDRCHRPAGSTPFPVLIWRFSC